MTIRQGAVLIAGLLTSGSFAQNAPQYFELLLPDFSDQAYPGGPTTIDHPPRPLERITIQFLSPFADAINYGDIFVTVNGKGLGNAFERRANARGKILVMTPAFLSRRPDDLFDATENAVEVRAVDPRRGRTYYQNWVLRASEPGRNAYFSYSTTVSPDDPQAVPPDLVLAEPSAPITMRSGQASVRVTIRGTVSAAAAGARVVIDGKPVVAATKATSEDFSQQVTLDRSSKAILVEAYDKKNHRRSISIPVVHQSLPTKLKFAGERYAVVIGVSRFGGRKGAPPDIAATASDAGEFAKQLQLHAGFAPSNIRVLLDEKAVLSQVKIALGDFAAKAKADDLVAVYVATHGMHDPLNQEKLYLATADTQIDHLSTTALELGELESWVDSRVRCNNVLLFFDVGHKLDTDFRFPPKNLVNNHLLTLFEGQEGRAVLVSGSADEVSLPSKTTGVDGSLFTHRVVEGLAGAADRNADGIVTADELFRYVAQNVRVDSGDKQTPRFRLGRRSDLQIAGAK